MATSGTLRNISIFANLPLLLLRFAGSSILLMLNIWLFSGIGEIIAGTMGITIWQTTSLTMTGAIVLIMIPGVEQKFTVSGGTLSPQNKFRRSLMWGVGIFCYGTAILYSMIGAYKCLNYTNGIYIYITVDWFGLIASQKIECKLTAISYSFTLIKAIPAIAVDYIAGILVEEDLNKLLTPTGTTASTADLRNYRITYDTKFSELTALNITSRPELLKGEDMLKELLDTTEKIRTVSTFEADDKKRKLDPLVAKINAGRVAYP